MEVPMVSVRWFACLVLLLQITGGSFETADAVQCRNFILRLNTYIKHLEVKCYNKPRDDFQVLQNDDLSRCNLTGFTQLTYRDCAMPTGNQSLVEMLDFLDPSQLAAVETLFFVGNLNMSKSVPLEPSLFNGLDSLSTLSMKRASPLPLDNPRMFEAVSKLKVLDLRQGDGRDGLAPNILRPLNELITLELMENNLEKLPDNVVENLWNLETLKLFSNRLQRFDRLIGTPNLTKIDFTDNQLQNFSADAFSNLPKLKELVLSHNRLSWLPEGLLKNNINLVRFIADHQEGTVLRLPDGLFKDLVYLENVSFAYSRVAELPENIFEGVKKLIELNLSNNLLTSLPERLFRHQSALVQLNLKHNQLRGTLPDALFDNTANLRILYLSFNKLNSINSVMLKKLKKLQKLYVDHNELITIDQAAFREQMYTLEVLDLSYNNVKVKEQTRVNVTGTDGKMYLIPKHETFFHLNALLELNLAHNNFTVLFYEFKDYLQKLEVLNFSHNLVTSIGDLNFPFLSQNIKTIDLSGNQIRWINFTESFLRDSKEKLNALQLKHNPIECVCMIHPLLVVLNTSITSLLEPEIQCANPPNLEGISLRSVKRSAILCRSDEADGFCPSECVCYKRPEDRTVIIDCADRNLTKVPAFPSPSIIDYSYVELKLQNNHLQELPVARNVDGWGTVRSLNVANNRLSKLSLNNLPERLQLLDVSANQLTVMDPEFEQLLAERQELSNISLAENPWECKCKSSLLFLLQDGVRHITDITQVRCADGRIINAATVTELCSESLKMIVIVCIVITTVLLLIATAAWAYVRYKQEIKVWLFTHNLLQFWVIEQELDQDKRYDAFVSYSHKDESFITEHLVPTLESEPLNFRLCWHVRDFMPGEMISSQITKAVEESRRTIVVLSINYLQSVWGQMEFKTAYLQSMEDRRNRVIAIIYEDIGSVDELDSELRAYLKTTTYLRWGDPWFWEKLRYAMPHKQHPRGTQANDNIRMASVDKLNLLQATIAKPTVMADSSPAIQEVKADPPFVIVNPHCHLHH